MKNTYHFVALSGSLRVKSYNTMVLKSLQNLAPSNVTIEQIFMDEVPLYNSDLYEKKMPEAVQQLSKAILKADAFIIVSPEYNHSVPGVLKNTIDFLSTVPAKPFNKKPMGIMSASPGIFGGIRVQNHLRLIFSALNANVLNNPEVAISEVNKKFDEKGILNDEKTEAFLKLFIKELTIICNNDGAKPSK